jgi:hypothetical protein
MAKTARKAAWRRPGSPIGKKGPRKANPKYKRSMREPWSAEDVRTLKQLVKVRGRLFRDHAPTSGILL